MRALWSSRQNCSHNVSQKFKRIRCFSEHDKKQGGSGTELEPETGTVGTVFPETESGTGTAGTVFPGTEAGTVLPKGPRRTKNTTP